MNLQIIKKIWNIQVGKKLFSYFFLLLLIYFLQDFVPLFLIAFLLSYVFLTLGTIIHQFMRTQLSKITLQTKVLTIYHKTYSIPIQKIINFLLKFFNLNTIITILYILFFILLVLIFTNFIPKIIIELKLLPQKVPFIAEYMGNMLTKLEEFRKANLNFQESIEQITSEKNIEIIKKVIENFKSIGEIIIRGFIALILSYFFVIDRDKLRKYLERIKGSVFQFIYLDLEFIFKKISKGFGLLFKAQSLIALVNTLLTVIGLIIIGMINGYGFGFPFLSTFSIFVFILSFIPVLGVFISTIPIAVIGFTMGGIIVVFEIIFLVMIIHIIEAYYLNPKIVSTYMELPISLSFVILFISEYFFGLIGLLIGVPLFYIIVDLLKDIDRIIKEKIDQKIENIMTNIDNHNTGKNKKLVNQLSKFDK